MNVMSIMRAQIKNHKLLLSLLYHNLTTICANTVKCISLLQNLLGILMHFTELGYYIYN